MCSIWHAIASELHSSYKLCKVPVDNVEYALYQMSIIIIKSETSKVIVADIVILMLSLNVDFDIMAYGKL